ncbi:ribosome small subunit-dependent GTPase A [Petroclostridium sp. X23]|uniref:ribosome small subunit-dependent GTPase A n=1 Tax=Petroclostridium sp. X23 TaxID=3045146 RepID=UPI0024AD5D5A|nr:ribosome small subunit-dependent GTPase A [Petroclostridium sp. X23]WHH59892.1 ribosome small subunit-dependent GTPase A [Petroclostridium sp. X23]
MPEGIILKGIGGFYYIETRQGIIECKARGKFRKKEMIPLVGDRVEIEIADHDNTKGIIEKIMLRKNVLVRPPVANVQQIVIVASVCLPAPNLLLLDKLITVAESRELDIIICLNKIDLDDRDEYLKLVEIYQSAGYHVICTSSRTLQGINDLRNALQRKISVFAGASGVGKSSLLNTVDNRFELQTGEISKKIDRGKHTTRHVELLELNEESYVVDTPGFTSFELMEMDIKADDLEYLFREYQNYHSMCKFRGCTHTSEPGCVVIEAVNEGKISRSRYDNYVQFYNQLKDIRDWHK